MSADPTYARAVAITDALNANYEEKNKLRAELGQLLERQHLPMFLKQWAQLDGQDAESYLAVAEAVIQEVGLENVVQPPDIEEHSRPLLQLIQGGLKDDQ